MPGFPKSAGFTLWSVGRPRKGHREDVTNIPSGDNWSGSLWRTRGRDQSIWASWETDCEDPGPTGWNSRQWRQSWCPPSPRAPRLSVSGRPLNHPRSRYFPNNRAVAMNASLLPLSVSNRVALCKTGSATVTMALFVAEKCALENSENRWSLVRKQGYTKWSLRSPSTPEPRSPSARPAERTRSCSVPETADQAAQPFRNRQLCGAPALWRGRLAECLPGPVKLGD